VTEPSRSWRPTIRARLTLLYAAAFFVAGAVLVALMYLYLGQVLDHQSRSTDDLQHLSPAQHDALVAELQQARDGTLNTMLLGSLVALAAVGVIAAAIGWFLAGRTLLPLQHITATARRVADRNLHERIGLDGPNDEIKDLADTFDTMLARLDRAFDSQRRFVANASHELRTPLTTNRTLIEVALENPNADAALRRLGDSLLAVNERHERLIDGLLTLASSEEGITAPVRVDLGEVAGQVVAEAESAARDAGVELRTDLQPAPVGGDPLLVERLIQNLIDNAIRYNLSEHGWMGIATKVVDGVAHLTVENTGPPVPPDEVEGLFEPFRRLGGTERLADSASSSMSRGAGLGLSIVRSVAEAHGGRAQSSAREEGGLTVVVQLPVFQAATVSRERAPGAARS
jgi:signal transduction histidine kinase